jgi:hypothetical protein
MDGVVHLVNNTAAAMLLCLLVPLVGRWSRRFTSRGTRTWWGVTFPREYLWLLPSGICTAVVIPTTTLMYSLKDPVTGEYLPLIVAQPLMRGSLIITSLLIDLVLTLQGISRKKLVWQEVVAAGFAFGTVWFAVSASGPGRFNFLNSPAAVTIMLLYIVSYTIRQYIMGHYTNTQGSYDVRGFFVVEQTFAAVTVITATAVILTWPGLFGWQADPRVLAAQSVFREGPHFGAAGSGLPYGIAAFFSVFLFVFHGKTRTFAVLTNRLASLFAAPVATLVFVHAYGGQVKAHEFQALTFAVIALGFMAWGEMSRRKKG